LRQLKQFCAVNVDQTFRAKSVEICFNGNLTTTKLHRKLSGSRHWQVMKIV